MSIGDREALTCGSSIKFTSLKILIISIILNFYVLQMPSSSMMLSGFFLFQFSLCRSGYRGVKFKQLAKAASSR